MLEAVAEAGVIHHPDNMSNHSPIYVKLEVSQLRMNVEETKSEKRTSWATATEESKAKYKEVATEKLNSLETPECIDCLDLHCQAHTINIEDYTMNILNAIEESAKESLPMLGGGSGGGQNKSKQVDWYSKRFTRK